MLDRTIAQGIPLIEQPSLFSELEQRQIRHSGLGAAPMLEMSPQVLADWKKRIVHYQQQVLSEQLAQEAQPIQGGLFDMLTPEPSSEIIDPFRLTPQNIEFWRWPADEPGTAALYFVMDYECSLLLYVGETCKANQRWKGVHDCKRYVRNYLSAHRVHTLPVRVGIGFWTHAPEDVQSRQSLELSLIEQWRSPFNKENWKYWGTPFTWGKPS